MIENENLMLNKEFVNNFSEVESAVEDMSKRLSDLESLLDAASAQLQDSRNNTHEVLEKARKLNLHKKHTVEKKEVLNLFSSRFILPLEDEARIRNSDSPIDEDFFKSLKQLHRVRIEARHMLDELNDSDSTRTVQGVAADASSTPSSTSQEGNSHDELKGAFHYDAALAVDILHQTSDLQEIAYERIFVWIQRQCKELITVADDSEAEEEVSRRIRKGLQVIRHRTVYFNHSAKEISRVRRQLLMQKFHETLTKGGPTSRPIDIHAYDIVRYTNDMLAWIHEQVAAEREFFIQTFSEDEETEGRSKSPTNNTAYTPPAPASRNQDDVD
ncbi:component of oligomeric golgi complex, putative [Perkinsus marinus ATCC 50983]|uniref:Conserved oligomeric Golgi complex subunit 6 n=1 Tax=Perkinsus marinus (strain ATCC 50983 / TXsc) TaxID=423536 RepID=C5LSP4_PERM5|nr:component of oligomeric golgi complex, putative [Perkinsus marinus ATCC 50983]EER00285.1 component of oligomeric golgi complex, putative [Perkinsus marinus ATCC 50983]|eukprot:XP_002767567.1 component of oligomeric golgi complex, putative [Perkinsus marinus ATCC 50983]